MQNKDCLVRRNIISIIYGSQTVFNLDVNFWDVLPKIKRKLKKKKKIKKEIKNWDLEKVTGSYVKNKLQILAILKYLTLPSKLNCS